MYQPSRTQKHIALNDFNGDLGEYGALTGTADTTTAIRLE
jgi:hypothetical protein